MSTYQCLPDIVYIWTVQQVTYCWCMAQHLPLMVTCVPPSSLLYAITPTNHRLTIPQSPPYPTHAERGKGGCGGQPSGDWWVCCNQQTTGRNSRHHCTIPS